MTALLEAPLDTALPMLPAVFDSGALSSLLSAPVLADRLRHKRGVSAVVRLRSRASTSALPAWAEPAPRWLAMYADGHEGKAGKTLRRARTEGHSLQLVECPGQPDLAIGPITLDPKLHRVLRPFAGDDGPLRLDPGAVLNYNPFRRVVFRWETGSGPMVCKAGPEVATEPALLAELAARGVPVLPRAYPDGAPSGGGLRYYPWLGHGDLQRYAGRADAGDVESAAHAAGAALAALHAQPARLVPGPAHDPVDKLRRVGRRNRMLLPAFRGRLDAAHTTTARLLSRDHRLGLVHGDFSADQVLVDDRAVLLADFDRSTAASPGMDLGSFLAVELLAELESGPGRLRCPFLDAYADTAGRLPDDVVVPWTAAHLLDRLDEPFRACSPRWREEIVSRLELLEDVLA